MQGKLVVGKMSLFRDMEDYFTHVVDRLRIDVASRRREDRALNLLTGNNHVTR